MRVSVVCRSVCGATRQEFMLVCSLHECCPHPALLRPTRHLETALYTVVVGADRLRAIVPFLCTPFPFGGVFSLSPFMGDFVLGPFSCYTRSGIYFLKIRSRAPAASPQPLSFLFPNMELCLYTCSRRIAFLFHALPIFSGLYVYCLLVFPSRR